MDEPKIFEVYSDKISCFVCAKDIQHASEVISTETGIKVIVFVLVKEVPSDLFIEYEMERETEDGVQLLNFKTYIDTVRGTEDWEIICRIENP